MLPPATTFHTCDLSAAETMSEQVRVFFGRRLDCAQCHDHPYENGVKISFGALAAFFDRMFILSEYADGFRNIRPPHSAGFGLGRRQREHQAASSAHQGWK